MSLIEGATGPWEMVIGMEVHAQVTSKAKFFSGASTEFGAAPNSHVSLVDAAMPGMLPVINGFCVEQAVRTGLGLKAEINLVSVFDRKNYFYPDLPPGYQISQYSDPVVGKGEVVLDMEDGTERRVGITRLHLEQDAGKSLHDQDPKLTFVDLNRAGVALMEIVSEPDIRSPEEAGAYLAKLRSILRYLGTCDGNMEEGSMRADVNVSVRRPGEDYGTRCEIKNLNSIRFVQQAIVAEAERQVDVIEADGEVAQETRLFDTATGTTRPMRTKEEAHDYRYFPDPDLLPLELDPEWVEKIKADLPELPDEKRARWHADFDLPFETIDALIIERETAEATEEEICRLVRSKDQKLASKYFVGEDENRGALNSEERKLLSQCARRVANFVSNNVRSVANTTNEPMVNLIPRANITETIEYLERGEISSSAASTIVEKSAGAVLTIGSVKDLIDQENLWQISDTSEIEAKVDKVIAAAPKQVEDFRSGNEKVLGWFVGQVMKATQGKANPQAVNEILRKKLSG